MPYANHLRLTMSGEFRTTGNVPFERFAYRLNLSDPGGLAGAARAYSDAAAVDYAADAVAFHGSTNVAIGGVARLTEVKLARIGVDGKYREDPFIVAVDTPGGAATMENAPQVSIAVSLVTDRRGPTGKGRFYLPAPSLKASPNDGRVPAVQAEFLAEQVKIFLNAVNNRPGIDGPSPTVTIASVKGYNSDVTGVRVGRVLDTIRSRRTSIPETYALAIPLV